MPDQSYFDISTDDGRATIALRGEWTVHTVAGIASAVKKRKPKKGARVVVDGSGLKAFDTSGAWYLRELEQESAEMEFRNFRDNHKRIYDLVSSLDYETPPPPRGAGFIRGALVTLGEWGVEMKGEAVRFITFFGALCAAAGTVIVKPWRFRLRSTVYHLNEVALRAVPIVALMAFLTAIVLGYQGAYQLRQFGATIFTVDLVTISILREMGVLLTAIMVAGRSGSAFAAQLGVMKLNEEIDAMRTMGFSPFELLVLPRVLAIIIAMPLLTVVADFVGIMGTYIVSIVFLDMSFTQFIERVRYATYETTFWVGIIKSPFFGLIVGMIGCMQGMQVRSSAEEVGSRTTRSVVQAIFLVLLADALFSILFTELGI